MLHVGVNCVLFTVFTLEPKQAFCPCSDTKPINAVVVVCATEQLYNYP